MTIPQDDLAAGAIENIFSVVGGEIDISGTNFLGLINGATALSLSNSVFDGSTFLDALNAADFGASGVRDADSSTLSFSSASTPEPTSMISLIGLGFLGIGSKLKKKAS